jgi:hypothetical protein
MHLLVLAAEAASAPPLSFGATFVQYLLVPICTAAAGVATAALAYLASWLREKAKTSKVAGVLSVADNIALTTVAHVQSGMRAKLEKAAEDGEITSAEAAELKTEGMRLLKEGLGAGGLAQLKSIGISGGFLETFLSGLLERALDIHQAVEARAVVPVAATASP